MSTYIFILGKDPELSLAELEARYPSSEGVSQTTSFVRQEISDPLDQREFNKLGGQIKAGEFFGTCTKEKLVPALVEMLLEGHESGKLNYGISLYEWPEKNLRNLLLNLKKEFKKQGVSSRFANQNFKNISTAQHKGLKGAPEILVCKEGNDFHLAKVVAVQDIDSYSKRDYKKPFRDMKVGMLPPKLAQAMINLTGSDGKIWDPFCGGGVLVMEGLLMGHDMMGSDINAKTLEGAKKNVEWLKKEFNVKNSADLFVHDATKVLKEKKYDAICFEGYLGPPQTQKKSKKDLDHTLEELENLYRDFFNAIKGFKGPIVIGLPFFRTREGDLHLKKVPLAAGALGFKKELTLKYARPDQLVGREIIRFKL